MVGCPPYIVVETDDRPCLQTSLPLLLLQKTICVSVSNVYPFHLLCQPLSTAMTADEKLQATGAEQFFKFEK